MLGVQFGDSMATPLDAKISELALKYLPLARELLQEAIRIPADYVDKPVAEVCHRNSLFSVSSIDILFRVVTQAVV
jgi:hypothetical protein